MALAEKMLAARYGAEIVDHHTYVVAGDGCLMEGISHEAIALAGHLKLSKLILLWDDNGITIDGAVSLANSVDQLARFQAAGWTASRIDGHDPEAIAAAIEAAQSSDRPVLIACKTVIGYGAPTKAGTACGSRRSARQGRDRRRQQPSSPGRTQPFDIPDNIAAAWADAADRAARERAEWTARYGQLDAGDQAEV